MARPIRIQYPGALYHIMSRGNERADVFKGDKDYLDFLAIFQDVIERYNWQCFAYCLMKNHYHLLIKTNEANLSLGMRQLNGKYTQKFNINHDRIGHLFQGRFKSVLVEEENYKNQLIRYIVLNPLRGKLVGSLQDWRWSSHPEIMGDRRPSGCVDIKDVLTQFYVSDVKRAREIYREYLDSKVDNESSFDSSNTKIILGSIEFIERIKSLFKEQKEAFEILKRERMSFRPSLSELFNGRPAGRTERNEIILRAHLDNGYSLSEIGRYLDLHYSSIGKIVNKSLKRKKS